MPYVLVGQNQTLETIKVVVAIEWKYISMDFIVGSQRYSGLCFMGYNRSID